MVDTRHGTAVPICLAENKDGQMELILELVE